jgi:hypothetical protein
VVAFGQEEKEMINYTKYLDRAKSAGIKSHCRTSVLLGAFMASIFFTYSYSFFMGSVWIYHRVHNDLYDRTYRAGDILSCFFGIVFGMFALGMTSPNLKAVAEG